MRVERALGLAARERRPHLNVREPGHALVLQPHLPTATHPRNTSTKSAYIDAFRSCLVVVVVVEFETQEWSSA